MVCEMLPEDQNPHDHMLVHGPMVAQSHGSHLWCRQSTRLSIRIVIWILLSDTVFVNSKKYQQILRRQCYLIWCPKYFLGAGLPAHQCWWPTTPITTGGTYITTYHHIYHHRWHKCGCGSDDEYSSVGPSDVSRRVPNPVMGREMLEALLLNKSSQCVSLTYCVILYYYYYYFFSTRPHMAILCQWCWAAKKSSTIGRFQQNTRGLLSKWEQFFIKGDDSLKVLFQRQRGFD